MTEQISEQKRIYKGIIIDFEGHWSMSTATLTIRDDEGIEYHIPCEYSSTLRKLDYDFGGVIGEGLTINSDGGHIGQRIYYFLESGRLSSFIPEDEATPEIISAFEEQEKK